MADANLNPNQKPQGEAKTGLSWSQPNTPSAARPLVQQAKPAAAEEGDSTGRIISIIVGIVIVFALVAWSIVALRHRSGPVSTTASSTVSDTMSSTTKGMSSSSEQVAPGGKIGTVGSSAAADESPTMSSAQETFGVPSPQAAGASVSVQNLSLSQPTWIIVYENRGGQPGNILGAGLYFPGDTSASVPLLRATVAGQTYYVTAAVDNGAKTFSVKDEYPVAGPDGTQLWITFEAH